MGTYKYETSIDYNYYWKYCNNLNNYITDLKNIIK